MFDIEVRVPIKNVLEKKKLSPTRVKSDLVNESSESSKGPHYLKRRLKRKYDFPSPPLKTLPILYIRATEKAL